MWRSFRPNLNLPPATSLKSLTKMASKCTSLREISETHLFHHGLIKLLVINVLQKTGQSWNQFLRFEGFEASGRESEKSAMPIQASLSQKGKEKVMNRTLRSSDPLIPPDGIPPIMNNEQEIEGGGCSSGAYPIPIPWANSCVNSTCTQWSNKEEVAGGW